MKIVAKNGFGEGGGGKDALTYNQIYGHRRKNQTNSLWFLFVVLMVKDK